LSGLRLRPFCRYHCLTSAVHAARTESCSYVVDTHGEVELRVIGVLVVVNTMVCDDVTDRAAVDCKQQRPEHRPLRKVDLELHDW